MAVYPFFKMQNCRQNKISGSISVICFTVRHKYCSITLTKKRSSALGKNPFDLQFHKTEIFLQKWPIPERNQKMSWLEDWFPLSDEGPMQHMVNNWCLKAKGILAQGLTTQPKYHECKQPWPQKVFCLVTPEHTFGKD